MKKNSSTRFSLGVRQKVIMVLMAVLLVALSLSGWMALQQEKDQIEEETNQRGNDIARFVAKSLAYSIVGYDYHTIQLLLDEITRSNDISFALVVNQRGKEMGVAGKVDDMNVPNVKIFHEPIRLEDEIVGELSLGVSSSRVIDRLEANKYSLIAREAIIILLIAFGEFIALSLIIIRPVKLLSQSIGQSSSSSKHIFNAPPLSSGDEFGELADKFNKAGSELQNKNVALKKESSLNVKQLKKAYEKINFLENKIELLEVNIEEKSTIDSLTETYNRQYFEACITNEMSEDLPEGDQDSMIIIDIDNFKSINSLYGNLSGDVVLKVVAETLKENLKDEHKLCRIDGEEFAVLCFRTKKDDVVNIANSLKYKIEKKTINIGNEMINVTISLGCASISSDNKTRSVNAYYYFANKALYFSKFEGRNRCTHYDDLNQEDLDKINLS